MNFVDPIGPDTAIPCKNALLCAGKGVSKLSKKQSGQRWKVALEALQKVNLHLEV